MSLRTARVTDALHQSHGNFMRSCVKRIKREVFTYSAFYFGQDGLNWVHSNNSCLPTIYSQAQVNRLTYIEVYVLMPSQPLAPHVPHKQSFFPSIPLFLSPISNTLIHNNNLLPPPPLPSTTTTSPNTLNCCTVQHMCFQFAFLLSRVESSQTPAPFWYSHTPTLVHMNMCVHNMSCTFWIPANFDAVILVCCAIHCVTGVNIKWIIWPQIKDTVSTGDWGKQGCLP